MNIAFISAATVFVCTIFSGCGWVVFEDALYPRPITTTVVSPPTTVIMPAPGPPGSLAQVGPYGDYPKFPNYSLYSSGLDCTRPTRTGYHNIGGTLVEYCEWDCAYLYPGDSRSVSGVRVEYHRGSPNPIRQTNYSSYCQW